MRALVVLPMNRREPAATAHGAAALVMGPLLGPLPSIDAAVLIDRTRGKLQRAV